MYCILFQKEKTSHKGVFYKVSYSQCGRFESGDIFGIGHGYEPIRSSNSHVHCQQTHARLKLYRHIHSLGKMSRQLLSSALIQPHFDYAATSWYMGSTEHLKHKLQVTQNKVVRFILNKPPRQHIGQNELDMVNLLNTEHRVKQLMMTHMYNIYSNNAPSYLCQRFIRIQDQHQHHTRLP